LAADDQVQGRVNQLLINDVEARPLDETDVPLPFSPFIHAHAQRAGQIVSRMFDAADTGGVAAAIDVADEAAETESGGVVKQATRVFITHHPQARRTLSLPAVEVLETEALPEGEAPPPPASATPAEAAHVAWEPVRAELPRGQQDQAALESAAEPAEEQALDWFREDPFANDHHSHWHEVYPTSERQGGQRVNQPRQGELFFYMHRQMLARYDTERVIAGLGPVKAFEHPYTAPIPEGYARPGYAARAAGLTLHDVPGAPTVDQLRSWHAALQRALTDRKLQVDGQDLGALDENQLGAATEPSDLYLRPDQDLDTTPWYGNLHGMGHVLCAYIAPFDQRRSWPGVMNYTETAIRDPFFYRWHRHVDELYSSLQGELPRESYGDYAARVRFPEQGPDVLLAFSDRILGVSAADFDFDAFARRNFGNDFSANELTTDTLLTGFGLSQVSAPAPGGRETYWTTHLQHRPFSYFIRLENQLQAPQQVTIRIFLAHESLVEDYRMWIELDKFETTLAPGTNLLGRPDALSSVIKRKGVNAPGARPPNGNDTWCDCGWPYTLLIPSGESGETGSTFKLLVSVTDWEQDQVGSSRSCGSMSYCGATDEYPDARRMGYPFDRPLSRPIAEIVASEPSMTMRDVSIRCTNRRPRTQGN
jgi:tyrosinase